MEYHRWAARSQLRPDGLRYARRMAAPVTAPTLQLHGELDPCVLPTTARGSGPLRRRRLRVAGAARASATSRRRRRRTSSAAAIAELGQLTGLTCYSQGPVPTSAGAVLPARAASATCWAVSA